MTGETTMADDIPARLRAAHDRLNCNVAPCGRRMKSEADLDADRAFAMAACWKGAALIESQAAENERLRSIIGDTVWCHACGTVVPFDKPECDCVAWSAPDLQRLRAYDADAHQLIAEMRAEIARLRAGGWRPISEAPRDGTDILIAGQGFGWPVRVAFWDEARGGQWSIWPGRERAEPKCWQSLPPAPDTTDPR